MNSNMNLTMKCSFFAGLLASGLSLFGLSCPAQSYGTYYLLVGRYAPADSAGIFVYTFNTRDGKARFISSISGVENPSFVTFSPHHHYVYSVSETHTGAGGGADAFQFDAKTGKLRFIDRQLSHGLDPCMITEDATSHWVFVANYTSGSFSEFPVKKGGGLGPMSRNIQHHGHGVNPLRQEGPHVHFVNIAPNNRDIFVSDLGLDKVFTYELDPRSGKLPAGNPPYVKVTPGAGPRHQDFSPDHRFDYLIQEMGGLITVFRYHPGRLDPVQTVSTIPPGYKKRFTAADIHLSPHGNFLYGSNRDDLNDIVIFRVNKQDGKLHFLARVASGGKTPRNFVITPDGRYLFVGHQNSNLIRIFKRNPKTGMLRMSPETIRIPHAVCLKMIPDS